MVFDEIIFRQAQDAGAETIEHCEVTELKTDATGVTVFAQHDGEACAFRGRLAIGADGAHSLVSRILNPVSHKGKNISFALRAYFEGLSGDTERVDILFDRSFFPGYAWIFPLGGGRANVGMGMVMDPYRGVRVNLRERFAHWLEHDPIAQARLSNARLLGRVTGWPLNTYSRTSKRHGQRVLLIGDAANLVDPINGGQKHTFLFKLKDGNILLDDKPEQTHADASTKSHGEETTAAQAAGVDEDVEFPSVSADGDVNDVPWIM
jgi:flavin-dependent dehydrogenase